MQLQILNQQVASRRANKVKKIGRRYKVKALYHAISAISLSQGTLRSGQACTWISMDYFLKRKRLLQKAHGVVHMPI